MRIEAPLLDRRDAAMIAADLRRRFTHDPELSLSESPPLTALIEIFSQYCDMLIRRINKAPHKSLMAFLDLLPVVPELPKPARAPVSFVRAPGGPTYAKVPRGTQVAALPPAGTSVPAIFETEQELDAISGEIAALMTHQPSRDRYANHTTALLSESPSREGVLLFQGRDPIEHVLYLSDHRLEQCDDVAELRLECSVEGEPRRKEPARSIEWQIWDGKTLRVGDHGADLPCRSAGIPIIPQHDDTDNLSATGTIVFRELDLRGAPRLPILGFTGRWLRCRVCAPPASGEPALGSLPPDPGPRIKTMTMQVTRYLPSRPVEAAFVNQVRVDHTKEFYIFGQKPKLGDTLNLCHPELFAIPGLELTLHVDLLNPRFGGNHPPIEQTQVSPNLKIRWESSCAEGWTVVGESQGGVPVHDQTTGFHDTTEALSKTGQVRMRLPATVQTATIHGVKSYWIRARIVSGDYGGEGSWELKDLDNPEKGFKFDPPTVRLSPPVLRSIQIEGRLQTPPERPDRLVTYNDFTYQDVTQEAGAGRDGFLPFVASGERQPALHIGFTFPKGWESRNDRDGMLTVYCLLESPDPAARGPESGVGKLAWEYWNGQTWAMLEVVDGTAELTQSGPVQVAVSSKWRRGGKFDPDLYWLRVRAQKNDEARPYRLYGLVLNTVMAVQAMTIREEILGSSRHVPSQTYRTLQKPVLDGQTLEVKEPSHASDSLHSSSMDSTEWVSWIEVPDFFQSGPEDRHYMLDHLTGLVRFGDGKSGRIPPAGTDNIRMRVYSTGGGARGNTGPGTIAQLRMTVPYIQKVKNVTASAGGADAETLESFLARAPRILRHKQRAVTREDYEDLAMLASSEVARALCLPVCRLTKERRAAATGALSLIVVPRSSEQKPSPSDQLLGHVRRYLEDRKEPDVTLHIVGPQYVRLDVEVDVAVGAPEQHRVVHAAVETELAKFLHPIHGGALGEGWPFGELPPESSLHARIRSIPGVDHIRRLSFTQVEDHSGLSQTNHFLICSGQHRIVSALASL